MYALVGAHLAQLVLNWENDSFAMRQRMNICGIGEDKREQKPPAVLPASRLIRWFRLILALVVLCFTLQPIDHVSIDAISNKAHLFGALSGVLSGCTFLKVRNKQVTKQMRYMRNILKYAFWFSISYVIVQFIVIRFEVAKGFEERQEYCPWFQYECICQKRCYPDPPDPLAGCNITISGQLEKACGFNLTCNNACGAL